MNPAELLLTATVATLGLMATGAQLRRLLRGERAGVSAATWLAISVVNLTWAAHLAERGFYLMAAVDLVFLVGTVTVAVLLAPPLRSWMIAGGVAAVTLTAQIVAPAVGSVLLIGATVTMFAPQAVLTLRALGTRDSTAGVSRNAWAINTLIAGVWVAWGLVAGNPTTVLANLPILALAATITLGVTRRNRHQVSTPG